MVLPTVIFTLVMIFMSILTMVIIVRQKRLDEIKNDFINNMTHELKTPLSTLSVASSSLGNRSINQQEEKVEELSLIIKKQNRHLSELIDRILDINIWERDQVRLKKQPIVPEAWIRELIRAFLLKQEDPELDIKLDFRSATLSIHLDEVHMSTAINNLLSNAVKYGTTPCKIKMGVSTKNGFLVIGISDNGPGIKKEELKHVFEKFYRGKESKERVIKGLGLGLYYVKQIVEAHGGNISANSVPGKGAEFLIQIPVQNGDTTG